MAIIDTEGSSINLGNGNYPYNMGGFGGFGFGADGAWILLLLLLCGGNGFGFGGGNNMLYDINTNTNRGFDNLALNNGIDALQSAVTTGFANAEVGRCNSTTQLLQSMNTLSMGLQNCCCENRAGLADLKYTVATENCADRQALNEGIRDIIASNTANTQAILDKLCQQEIDAKNDLIATLRSQVSMADLRASQTAQTAQILAGQRTANDLLLNTLETCPVPSVPVYGKTAIFGCNNGSCGCGNTSIM